jgi:hypothetical protein
MVDGGQDRRHALVRLDLTLQLVGLAAFTSHAARPTHCWLVAPNLG